MEKGDVFKHQFTVTDTIYENFIASYDDKNPLHTDEAFAQARGFKSKVMHGNILGGFLSWFIGEGLPLKNVIIQKQEIAYFNPVFLNDTLNFTAEIAEVYESVNTVEFKYLFENEAKTKIAKGKIQIGII